MTVLSLTWTITRDDVVQELVPLPDDPVLPRLVVRHLPLGDGGLGVTTRRGTDHEASVTGPLPLHGLVPVQDWSRSGWTWRKMVHGSVLSGFVEILHGLNICPWWNRLTSLSIILTFATTVGGLTEVKPCGTSSSVGENSTRFLTGTSILSEP